MKGATEVCPKRPLAFKTPNSFYIHFKMAFSISIFSKGKNRTFNNTFPRIEIVNKEAVEAHLKRFNKSLGKIEGKKLICSYFLWAS